LRVGTVVTTLGFLGAKTEQNGDLFLPLPRAS
jgi:hypothetical protein